MPIFRVTENPSRPSASDPASLDPAFPALPEKGTEFLTTKPLRISFL
jgi:hypothetical protein